MTTLITITAAILVFAWILVQEWRELTRNQRYVVKLHQARPNERKAI